MTRSSLKILLTVVFVVTLGSAANAQILNLSDGSFPMSNPMLFQYTTGIPSTASDVAGISISDNQVCFDDIQSGVSFYRFEVDGNAGDVLQFDISVGDGSGGGWRSGFGLGADIITDDGTVYDLSVDPFDALPAGDFPQTFTVSQELSTDVNAVYLRAEFYGGDENGSNGIESCVFTAPVPEPSSATIAVVMLTLFGFASRANRS